MKIALVCDWFHPRVGGIERHLQDLSTRLAADGNDVVVITSTPGSDVVGGIPVRRVNAPRAPKFGFLMTPAGVRSVGALLDDERPDVAHCHVSIVSPAALGGAAYAVRAHLPTVLTFHSVVPQTRLLARFVGGALGTRSWPAVFSAVSQRVARDIAPIAGTRAIRVLPNGLDVDYWRVARAEASRGRVRLISVMRLNAKKRPLTLVRMMQALRIRLDESADVRLEIIGDGPMRPALERAIARYGLRDRITLLGNLARDDVRHRLASSDLFVLPTVRESFGLAALEARCVGLPVVAMRASGVAESIAHGREGLLASNDAELAEFVLLLVREAGLREAIAAHNRSTAPPFDWPAVIAQHAALYQEAIGLRESVRAEIYA